MSYGKMTDIEKDILYTIGRIYADAVSAERYAQTIEYELKKSESDGAVSWLEELPEEKQKLLYAELSEINNRIHAAYATLQHIQRADYFWSVNK